MPEPHDAPVHAPRAFWSGTLTFGLVSIPVDLYAAHRRVRPRLRMLSEDGAPLRRVYVGEEGGPALDRDELVRGYPIQGEAAGVPERFVEVSDEELEALAPELSRDIHLRRFVPTHALPTANFRRAYFLAPAGQSTRAYAVLAQTMARTERAGIATFVMRGKAQLVAIVGRDGVLQAETLRFADEIRSPEEVGLVEPQAPDSEAVHRVQRAIARLEREAIPLEPFRDERTEGIEALAREKLERGEGILRAPSEEAQDDEEEAWEPPDLVALLKARLAAERATEAERRDALEPLESRSRTELYERARELGIEGRSAMRKAELARAIRDRQGEEPGSSAKSSA